MLVNYWSPGLKKEESCGFTRNVENLSRIRLGAWSGLLISKFGQLSDNRLDAWNDVLARTTSRMPDNCPKTDWVRWIDSPSSQPDSETFWNPFVPNIHIQVSLQVDIQVSNQNLSSWKFHPFHKLQQWATISNSEVFLSDQMLQSRRGEVPGDRKFQTPPRK
jgi:hypothetical protein